MQTDTLIEWEVWLADGSTRNSSAHRWEDVPDGVLVVRRWGPNGVNWGDGVYGHPATWKQAAIVSDEDFARTLAEAQAASVPPSRR